MTNILYNTNEDTEHRNNNTEERKVRNRRQAISISLSEAREIGLIIPPRAYKKKE